MNKLIDKYNRIIDYLRISVTDRCNLRCIYCMPEEGIHNIPHSEILRYEEIIEVIQIARGLGINRFRITGGEPLVRKGIIEFLSNLKKLGLIFSLTTNGILLKEYAESLASIGLIRINISLDTLDKDKFFSITRGGDLLKVLAGIETVREMGMSPIKINTVVMKGINEDEIEDFVTWAEENELNVRFIEFMPTGIGEDLFYPLKETMQNLVEKNDLIPTKIPGAGPARNYRFKNSPGTVSFILPRSEPFCWQCNRLRLTASGQLRPCLASRKEIDLKSTLRRKHSEQEIMNLFMKAVALKPKKHQFPLPIKEMSQIGG